MLTGGMRVVVVGGSGLLGWHVVEVLRQRGHEVGVVARSARAGVDHVLDLATASGDAVCDVVRGYDGVVFAGGVYEGEGSVAARLRAGYVDPAVALVRGARDVGATRAVVLGSYYAYFERVHPEWELARHPYVRARLDQVAEVRAAAGPDLPVAFVEIPYVVGAAPGRVPGWAVPYVKWIRSQAPLLAPKGGTAVVSARAVAETAVTALENGAAKDIPVAEENVSWKDLIDRMATAAGRPRKVHEVPDSVVRALFQVAGLATKAQHMDIRHLDDLFLRELYVPPHAPREVDAAIVDTVTQ